jgi:hypothetical protein
MRKSYPHLPRYTWDQAAILNLWPAPSFAAIGIKPATIRKWAFDGKATRVGVGPNGTVLYHYEQVARLADTGTRRVA